MTRFQRVAAAFAAIVSAGDEDSLIEELLAAAVELTGAQYGALGILAAIPATGLVTPRLARFHTVGLSPEEEQSIGEWQQSGDWLSLFPGCGGVVRIRDLRAHPLPAALPLHHPVLTSFMGVPLRSGNMVAGGLYLANTLRAGGFSRNDEKTVVSLVAVADVVLENRLLHEEIADLAGVRDREKIARNLHDNVIQRIFATGLSLQALAVSSGDGLLGNRIQIAVDELDSIIQDIRGIIFALRGQEMDGPAPLRAQLLGLVIEIGETVGTAPVVHLNGPVDNINDEQLNTTVVAVARELLTEATRHAGVTAVDFYVRVGANITVKVVDNGSFPGPGQPTAAGNGVSQVTGWAQQLGGSLTVRKVHPSGTEAIFMVPRKPAPA